MTGQAGEVAGEQPNRELRCDEDTAKRLIAMGQMAASLAHEIRNPLGSMELFCSLLKKDLKEQPNSLNLCEQIHHGIRTLDRIISNCLQFTRELRLQRTLIERPIELLQSVAQLAQARSSETQVALTLVERGSHPVSVDAYQLGQAVLNLVVNALEATAENNEHIRQHSGQSAGSESAVVEIVSDCSSETEWRITVTDHGIGISQEHRDELFDPLFTTKPRGTGLGLAIVHRIVTAHGGTVKLESNEHQGTTATVTLPARERE